MYTILHLSHLTSPFTLIIGPAQLLVVLYVCVATAVAESYIHDWEPDQLPLEEPNEEQKLRNRTPQIAIIGAGIAGASVAHHLHQFALLAQPLGVTVFEKEARAGGRIKSAHVCGELFKDIEVGAVAFSEEDWYLVQAMEEVGLKPASDGNDKKHVGVWDGDDFIVLSSLNNGSTSRWWRSVKLLWRYGMSPFRIQPVFQTVFEKMRRSFAMYQLFRNLQESVHKRSLDSEVSVSAANFFPKNRLITKNFINEVIRPGTRDDFSQDVEDANALSALIALREARPIAIDGGNWRLPNRMFKTSEANVELNSPLPGYRLALPEDGW